MHQIDKRPDLASLIHFSYKQPNAQSRERQRDKARLMPLSASRHKRQYRGMRPVYGALVLKLVFPKSPMQEVLGVSSVEPHAIQLAI